MSKPLPVVGVARLKEAANLLERLASQHQDVFAERVAEFRAIRRKSSERPASVLDAAAIAAGMADAFDPETTPVERIEQIQSAGLTHYDDPAPVELLLAAGLSTPVAFIDMASQYVALIEMDAETFKSAREAGTLQEAIDAAATELEDLGLEEARDRASAAFKHFVAAAGGDDPGEALSLIVRLVGQAIGQATTTGLDLTSIWPSLTDSPVSTDGLDETFSTTSPPLKPAA